MRSESIQKKQKKPEKIENVFKFQDYDDLSKTMEHYWDMGDNFFNGGVNIDSFPVKIRLLAYGLSQQTKFGDLPADQKRPSNLYIASAWKWDSWKKHQGRSRFDTRKDFIQLTEALIGTKSTDKATATEAKAYLNSVKDIMNTDVNPDATDDKMPIFKDEPEV